MYCTQCGCEIEDGFKFCPECGNRVVGVMQSDAPTETENIDTHLEDYNKSFKNNRQGYNYIPDGEREPTISKAELERTVDDIFWRDPRFTWGNVAKVQEKTGVDKSIAKQMIDERVNEVKRGVDKRICPVCGSRDIVVHRSPGSTTTISFTEGIYHTQYNPGKVRGECLKCGNKWKIKLI